MTHFMRVDINWVPWSERISSGIPRRVKMVHSASATVPASIRLNGIASGYLVAKSMRVKI